MAVGRNGIVTALDIGSNKVACFIAKADRGGGMRVIGIGHQVSRGMRAGSVRDMEAVETGVRAAVDAAERMAEETVKSVIATVNCGPRRSQMVSAEVPVHGQQVGDGEVRRVMNQAKGRIEAGGEILNMAPAGYSVDGSRGIREPRGMHGTTLGINLHVASASPGPVRNLRTVIERCHLAVDEMVTAGLASGLCCLVGDEMDLGVTLLDMGAGTTSIAVFYEGALVFDDVVPVGGAHVTNDIARGLSTSASHAERIKTLYGSAIPSPADADEMVSVPQLGESGADANQQVPRSFLIDIIQPRIEETLEMARDRLAAGGMAGFAGRRLVLTGAASQLTGVRELAARILDKQVRIGRPLKLQGLAEATEGPAFSACAGALAFATERPRAARAQGDAAGVAEGGRLARVGRWFKENF